MIQDNTREIVNKHWLDHEGYKKRQQLNLPVTEQGTEDFIKELTQLFEKECYKCISETVDSEVELKLANAKFMLEMQKKEISDLKAELNQLRREVSRK